MNSRIEEFKDHVKAASADPRFVHHEWFVTYHLELVERIAIELLQRYPDADRDTVTVLVWLHDYGKILDFEHQYEVTQTAGRKTLIELGFAADFVDRVIDYAAIIDQKLILDLRESPIEVQIVSSADAASHHVGPFMPEYWRENPDMTVEELMVSQKRKTLKDWERKMVLPEVRAAFEWRHRAAMEQAGVLPEKFLE